MRVNDNRRRATRDNDHLVVLIEVKGFESMASPVDYLAAAVGQYVLYRAALDFVGLPAINSPEMV